MFVKQRLSKKWKALSFESSLSNMTFEAARKYGCCLQMYQGVHASDGKEPFKDTIPLKNRY